MLYIAHKSTPPPHAKKIARSTRTATPTPNQSQYHQTHIILQETLPPPLSYKYMQILLQYNTIKLNCDILKFTVMHSHTKQKLMCTKICHYVCTFHVDLTSQQLNYVCPVG